MFVLGKAGEDHQPELLAVQLTWNEAEDIIWRTAQSVTLRGEPDDLTTRKLKKMTRKRVGCWLTNYLKTYLVDETKGDTPFLKGDDYPGLQILCGMSMTMEEYNTKCAQVITAALECKSQPRRIYIPFPAKNRYLRVWGSADVRASHMTPILISSQMSLSLARYISGELSIGKQPEFTRAVAFTSAEDCWTTMLSGRDGGTVDRQCPFGETYTVSRNHIPGKRSLRTRTVHQGNQAGGGVGTWESRKRPRPESSIGSESSTCTSYRWTPHRETERQETDRLRRERDELRARFTQWNVERDTMRGKLAEVLRKEDASTEAVEKARRGRDAIRRELDEAKTEITRLKNEMERLRMDRDKSTTEARQARRLTEIAKRERDRLRAEASVLTTEKAVLKAERDGMESYRDNLAAKKEEYWGRIVQLTSEIQSLKTERAKLQAEGDKARAEARMLGGESKKKNEQIRIKDLHLTRLKTERDELMTERGKLKIECDELKIERDDLKGELKTERDGLEARMAEARAQQDILDGIRSAFLHRTIAKQNEMKAQRDEAVEARHRIQEQLDAYLRRPRDDDGHDSDYSVGGTLDRGDNVTSAENNKIEEDLPLGERPNQGKEEKESEEGNKDDHGEEWIDEDEFVYAYNSGNESPEEDDRSEEEAETGEQKEPDKDMMDSESKEDNTPGKVVEGFEEVNEDNEGMAVDEGDDLHSILDQDVEAAKEDEDPKEGDEGVRNLEDPPEGNRTTNYVDQRPSPLADCFSGARACYVWGWILDLPILQTWATARMDTLRTAPERFVKDVCSREGVNAHPHNNVQEVHEWSRLCEACDKDLFGSTYDALLTGNRPCFDTFHVTDVLRNGLQEMRESYWHLEGLSPIEFPEHDMEKWPEDSFWRTVRCCRNVTQSFKNEDTLREYYLTVPVVHLWMRRVSSFVRGLLPLRRIGHLNHVDEGDLARDFASLRAIWVRAETMVQDDGHRDRFREVEMVLGEYVGVRKLVEKAHRLLDPILCPTGGSTLSVDDVTTTLKKLRKFFLKLHPDKLRGLDPSEGAADKCKKAYEILDNMYKFWGYYKRVSLRIDNQLAYGWLTGLREHLEDFDEGPGSPLEVVREAFEHISRNR